MTSNNSHLGSLAFVFLVLVVLMTIWVIRCGGSFGFDVRSLGEINGLINMIVGMVGL